MCIEFIRNHFANVPLGQIVTTRDLLHYGSRTAVDNANSMLVKLEEIKRVARGVFVRFDSQNPTLFEIVRAKAESFGRKVMIDCKKLANEFDIILGPQSLFNYAISGRSSTFRCIYGRVYMRAVGQRKQRLDGSKIKEVFRALWSVKEEFFESGLIRKVAQSFGRSERSATTGLIRWMPAWLSDYFVPE